jgi:hypothetical protein
MSTNEENEGREVEKRGPNVRDFIGLEGRRSVDSPRVEASWLGSTGGTMGTMGSTYERARTIRRRRVTEAEQRNVRQEAQPIEWQVQNGLERTRGNSNQRGPDRRQ